MEKILFDLALQVCPRQTLHNDAILSLTVGDLVKHASGLPRLPRNLDIRASDCYSEYSLDDMLDFLNSVCAGEVLDGRGIFQYSNLGYAVLRHSVAAALGFSFAEAITDRVLKPLAMSASTVADRETKLPPALMPGLPPMVRQPAPGPLMLSRRQEPSSQRVVTLQILSRPHFEAAKQ